MSRLVRQVARVVQDRGPSADIYKVTGGTPGTRMRVLPAEVLAAAVVGVPLAAVGAVAAVVALHLTPIPTAGLPRIPWPVLALLVAVAQSSVVNVQVRREARSISLTDAPFVLGLFTVAPAQFLAARVLGGMAAQLVARRQHREPVKLAFNTVACVTEAGVGLTIFQLLDHGGGPTSAGSWGAALLAAAVANAISGVAVLGVIARLEEHYSLVAFGGVAASSAVQATGIGCLGVVAAVALQADASMAVPLAVVALVTVAGYRAYSRLAGRHESLERLYRFGRVVSAHADSERILHGLLEQVCELLFADVAALTFFDDDLRPDSEAWLRRGQPLERRQAQHLTRDAGWIIDIVCRELRPVRLRRDSRDLGARHWLDSAGLVEAMIVPLMGEDGVLAALTVGDRLGSARGFDRDDLRLLETVGNHASIALRHGQLMERLRHDSMHDALTGVANRNYLQAEVDRLLAELESGGAPFAVAMLDLDTFKDVNDTLGHHQGDVLLREVARRLTEATGTRGVVTRFGGDEFAILVPDCRSDTSASRVGRALLDALADPIDIDGMAIDMGASIGVARAPDHASTRDELLKRADVAMYVAKRAGREVVVFDHAHETRSPTRLAMVAGLRQAIADAAIELHVQPQVNLATGQVVAAEALARWTDPQQGVVPPDDFVPLAERTGLIRPLTDLVLESAISMCAAWQRECPDVAVAVNLSARSLHDDGLDEQIGRLLSRYRLPARLLTLEITESSVMADASHTLGLLHRLRLRGVRLSIDDFGTGYSSLSYLRRLPVQEVKVDRSFVQRMHDESDDAAIVQSIVQLARTLDLDVVAEGVENRQVYELLGRIGCDIAQGYHLARPMPVDAFPRWFRENAGAAGNRLAAVGDA